jgi:hypothetical protein
MNKTTERHVLNTIIAGMRERAKDLHAKGYFQTAGDFNEFADGLEALRAEAVEAAPVDGVVCSATLDDAADDAALTMGAARSLLRDAAEGIRTLHRRLEKSEACPGCDGAGFHDEGREDDDGRMWSAPEGCPDCNGSGRRLAAPTSAATPAIVVPPGLIYALRHQRQVDEDGTECGVSRQAVDEAIVILEKVAASRVRHSCETDLLSDCPACSADADAAIAASDDSAATPGGQGWNVGESVAAWLLHRFGPDTPEGKEATLLLQWASTLTKPAASAAPGAVDALPAKWRGEAFDIAGQRGPGDEMAQAFQVCADELTAALAHPKPAGPRAGGEP